ncbi:MAG TPA: carbohydrate porin [Chthoniobacterales bacterium]|nr:carbohydrate porin [Chthoniobacterales bacterium]
MEMLKLNCDPPRTYFRYGLVTLLSLLTVPTLFAQQTSDSSDVSALKAQMEKVQQQNQQMQKEYEDRIAAMESKMQSLESKADSGTILNTRVLTDDNGKQYEGKGPVLDESFLKSLTRNFSFTAYVRAGVQFNGNGGGGNFNFELPDNEGGRSRLGNENDTYFELTWKQAHMLGDNPDVMDVSMVFTPAIRYQQNRATFVTGLTGGRENGSDFDFVMREAYLEMANVFKAAPEITFWGGQRFYDRFNIDSNDYFWLDLSGYGAGVKNIDVGIGKLWLAYLGGLDDDINSPNTGSFYKHTLDVRLKDIQIGPGKLMLVLIGNYEKGTTFTKDFNGNLLAAGDAILTHPVRTQDAYGIGGGGVYTFDLSAIGPKSTLQLWALAGWGATNFNTQTDLGALTGFVNSAVIRNPAIAANAVVNAGDAIQNQRRFRAGFNFVWNPNPCFSVGLWGFWQQDSEGFRLQESFVNPRFPTLADGTPNLVIKNAPSTRNLYECGIRPVIWIADNIAIQAQVHYGYIDNVRGFQTNNAGNVIVNPGTLSPTAFSRSGDMCVFTIAPTIKPKGGYYTRPELRVFGTYSIWSNSLKGSTTSIGEGGNTGGFSPSPYANGKTNQGWLIGTQVEWYF